MRRLVNQPDAKIFGKSAMAARAGEELAEGAG
jgi:hypothetical protein